MPEKLRLGTSTGVLLLIFGESFRAAIDGTTAQKDLKISIILINITDARRGEYIDSVGFVRPLIVKTRVGFGVFYEHTSARGSHNGRGS